MYFMKTINAEGEEITKWESENGPLFNKEPMVIQIRRLASPPSLQVAFELALKTRLKRLEDILKNWNGLRQRRIDSIRVD